MTRRCACGAEFRPQSKYDRRVLCELCLAKARQRWRHEQGQQDSSEQSDRNCYLPSEAEIREACQQIQSGWSEFERSKRAGKFRPLPVETTEVPSKVFTG